MNNQLKNLDIQYNDIKPDHSNHHHEHRHDGDCCNEEPYINTNKTGRNDPCHCGSGKKYKKCCL
jgi:uncharacterized protein YecA (UPF0149 family)